MFRVLMFLLFFSTESLEGRRVLVCFYDGKLRPVSVEYYWIDADDLKKNYPQGLMTHSINQHQDFVVKHKGLQLVFRMSNGDYGNLELNITQPGRINVILDSDYNYKCVKDCLGYKVSFGEDVTVEL